LEIARRGDETPSAESGAGGVGVQLQKINNKKYGKDLPSNVNHDIMKSNKNHVSGEKEVIA